LRTGALFWRGCFFSTLTVAGVAVFSDMLLFSQHVSNLMFYLLYVFSLDSNGYWSIKKGAANSALNATPSKVVYLIAIYPSNIHMCTM
jgi:hypothetical protein